MPISLSRSRQFLTILYGTRLSFEKCPAILPLIGPHQDVDVLAVLDFLISILKVFSTTKKAVDKNYRVER